MNPHLSSQQIAEWTAGERCPQAELHVRDCPMCQAQLSRMETALSLFRTSIRRWSDLPHGANRGSLWPAKGFFWSISNAVCWATLTAMLCVFITFTEHRSTEQRVAATNVATDAELLRQIDTEVSQDVPGPMEPLGRLISWDAGYSTNKHPDGSAKSAIAHNAQ